MLILVSEEISEVMDTTPSGDYEAGYGVTDLEINGNTTTVTYDTLDKKLGEE